MTPLEAVIDYIRIRRRVYCHTKIDRLTTEGMEQLVNVAAAADRLKEAEVVDAQMGQPLPGDSALAVYLNTLYERLAALDDNG